MCVIVHVAAKQTVEKQILQNCYDHNSHGWGIMWADKGKLHTVKDVSSFDKFYEAWKDVPRHAERGVHFRIRTHGETNQANCHPFLPREDVGLMHNGTIQTPIIDADMSDTHNFCKYELAPLIEGDNTFIHNEDFRKLMEEVIGWSKLLFIDAQGNSMRVKESAWHKDSGVWFSNAHSILPVTKYEPYYRGYNRPSVVASNTSLVVAEKRVEHRGSYAYPADREYPLDWRSDVESPKVRNSAVANATCEVVLDETTVKSDLYSGNKTDAEGLDYVTHREAEQAEMNAAFDDETLGVDDINPFPSDTVGYEDIEDIEDEDTGDDEFSDDSKDLYFDVDELSDLTYEEMLATVRGYPKCVASTLIRAMNACIKAGILEFDSDELSYAGLRQEIGRT